VTMAIRRRIREDPGQLEGSLELILERIEANIVQSTVQVILCNGDFVELEFTGINLIEIFRSPFFDCILQMANKCFM
jgi:hypothetical protein